MSEHQLDTLLDEMVMLKQEAFSRFETMMSDFVVLWLTEYNVPDDVIEREVPNCLLALGILVVRRRAEIEKGALLVWLRIQTRNLSLRFWRKTDRQSAPPNTLVADEARKQVAKLDGSSASYSRVAKRVRLPSGWLRRRHRITQFREAARRGSAEKVLGV